MLTWFSGSHDVYALIARRQYPKAAQLLERQLREDPDSFHLRQLLADVCERMGNRDRAVSLLEPLVDELAAEGFAAKAIAVLKKIQRIAPERSEIDLKLAALIEPRTEETLASRVPVIYAYREEEPAPPVAAAALADVAPDPTSEFVADWFEEAVEERRDFHWSPLLGDFSKDELAALIGGLRLLVKKPGAIIYGEDEPGDSLFILASGKARLYRRSGTGRYQQLGVLKEGEFFGEASVLTSSNRLSTVTAATECELLELDRTTFDRIAGKYPRIRRAVENLYDERATFETTDLE